MQTRYNTDISLREDRDNFFSNNSHSHDGSHELVAPSTSSNIPTTTIKKSIPIKLSSTDDSSRNPTSESQGNSSQKSSTENAIPKSPNNSSTSRNMSPNNSSPRSVGSPTSSTTILSNSPGASSLNNLETLSKTSKDKDTRDMKWEPNSTHEQIESGSFPSSPTTSKVSAASPVRTQLHVVDVALELNNDNNIPTVEDENLRLQSIGTKLSKPNDSKYPIIHICPSCNYPVAVFARLLPCQHMCCYPCSQVSNCYFCSAKINDVTQITHDPTLPGGGMFICQQDTCKRSYLSEYSLTEHQRLRAHGPYQGTTPAATQPSASTTSTSTSSSSSKSSSQSQSKSSSTSSHSSSSSKQTASPPSSMDVDKHSHKSHSQTIRSNSERDSHDSKRRSNNESNPSHNNYPKNGDPMDYYAHGDYRSSNRGNRSSGFNKQPHKQHDPRYNPYY